MYAIEVDKLHKSYSTLHVLRGLTLRVPTGSVYGLLGAHGTGKSTLVHLLLGFLKPTSGRMRLLGSGNLSQMRPRVGFVPERLAIHTRYSAREYLFYLGQFSDLSGKELRRMIDMQLELVKLGWAADQKLKEFSKSMLQRLAIAQALLTAPELLLVDEPFGLLDTSEQREVLDVLKDICSQGISALICSSYTNAVASLCDHVGVLHQGQIVAETDVHALRTPSTHVIIQVDQLTPSLRTQLQSVSSAVSCQTNRITLWPNTQQVQARVLRLLLDSGVSVLALEPLAHPLEQFYLRAVGQIAPATPTIPDTVPPGALASVPQITPAPQTVPSPPPRSPLPPVEASWQPQNHNATAHSSVDEQDTTSQPESPDQGVPTLQQKNTLLNQLLQTSQPHNSQPNEQESENDAPGRTAEQEHPHPNDNRP